MNIEKQMQVAVEEADLLICEVVKNIALMVLFVAILLICVCGFRNYMYKYHDPYLIDYDKPGIDITSEGD